MPQSPIRGILLDIEGTTSSISFVYDVMFPYVRDNIRSFLAENFQSADVQTAAGLLAIDLGHASLEDWAGQKSEAEVQKSIVAGVLQLMDDDVKATGLKQLQGLVWKNGFESGQMVAHVYDDVPSAIRQWNDEGIDVRIYSSGSIAAQKLFFGHTVAGNLLDQFKGHYDTTTGPKQDVESYRFIANEFDCPANQILFVSDVVAELTAADSAQFQTVLSIRPGNKPVAEGHGFDHVSSFEEIQLQKV